DSLREVANLSARTAAAAESRQEFRKTLAIRLTPTILFFLLGGILIAVGGSANVSFRSLAGGSFSLGLIALLHVVSFAAQTMFERPVASATSGTVRPATPPAPKTNDDKNAAA